MQPSDIILMAREAGFTPQRDEWLFTEMLERFFLAAAAAEREAVLDLVDEYAKGNIDLKDAIRARGEK